MSTTSTLGVLNIIRSRLLTFVPASGSTLAVLLGSTASGAGSDGKLYLNQAPDDVTGFWAVLRLIDAPPLGFDGGFLLKATCELILYGRPRSQQSAVERMADRVQEAWLNWSYTETGGHVSALDIASRISVPYAEPADRELVAIRLLLPFRCAPQFLTQYAA